MSLNLEGKRVAVIGSRTFDDKERLYKILTKNKDKIKLIVSGGASGADTLATDWAKDYGIPYLVFPAMWHDPETGGYDKGAGFRRNRYIIQYSDIVIAFYDGVSKGTANSLEIAKQLNKPIKIISFTPILEVPEMRLQAVESIKREPEPKSLITDNVKKNENQFPKLETTVSPPIHDDPIGPPLSLGDDYSGVEETL
jgi:hypothetical protein